MAGTLEDFVATVNGTSHLRIEHDFGGGFVRLRTSEAERRQAAQDIRSSEDIVLELLRNSRDAHAANIFLAMWKEQTKRHIVVVDDGDGIPPSMHELVFEPRVTSKLDTSHMDAWGMHGRGMALYSISMNSERSQVMSSDVGLGCSMRIDTDVHSLGEKTDQSSFPTFSIGDEGVVNVRGPRNILRTSCEFAIDCRANCTVFVGSPAEICATLYQYGMATLSTIDRLFCRDVDSLPLAKRLATANRPSELTDMAAALGLPISERTARRIMDGEVEAADSILDSIRIEAPKPSGGKTGASKRARGSKGLHLTEADKLALASSVRDAFSDIARGYYLEADVDPAVKVRNDRITVSIPVVHRL